jgi:hypothetical protein
MAAQSNAQQTFEELVAAVKQAESRGKRYAADGKTLTTSPKGALGEMQVMPRTIKDPGFGVIPAKDASPDEIARVGVDYLQAMTQKYGDTEKALIAYNWGPGSTDKWIASGADPKKLPDETRTYVQRVKGFLGKDVSRETVAKKEREPLPPSLPPMAEAPQATSAKATTVAKLDMANMPASYKAAFALAALADAQDEEEDRAFNENKQTETETFFASYKPVNHLASLDLGVEPIAMKDGGDVKVEPTERKDEPFFDAASRTFVDVMTGRRTPITEKDFTAKEQLAMLDAVKRSQARGGKGRVDYQDYPDASTVGPGYVDIRNTLGGFQYKQMPDGSTVITDRYDFHGPRVAEYEKMGTGEKVLKSAKNALTEFVTKGFSPRDLAGELGRAYIGSKGPEVNIRIPVNRANGGDAEPTAEEIAAASTPAFIAQKSGIGRKQGNISKALKSGEAYPAILYGASDVPYDLAGLPVDLTTMAMRPFGYKNEKPVMGSEYLKEKATKAGIRNPTPTDPTLKGFHTLGQVSAGVLAPGKIIEGAQVLKGKAAEALAGFKAGKAEKPGMTDLMTGQRIDAPEITPQMATEFSQWHQQAQNQLRNQNTAPAQDNQAVVNAIFDNLAGVNQQQIAADVAAGRLPGSVAPVPSLLRAEQNIARLPADAQEQLRLFEEAAGRPRPVAITQPATQLPAPPPYVEPPVQISAEFPFVGRLDEFAAGMKGPAQKEQLINQVKGKFREYEVARLEEALAGLGPKDKVTPAALQQALANTYSPSRYRSADLPSPGSMYDDSDNIFRGSKPIAGAMNLYLKETPEMLSDMQEIANLKKGLTDVLYGSASPEKIKNINSFIESSPLAAKIPELGQLKQRLESALPTYERFGKMQNELKDINNLLRYPLSYKGNGFNYFAELDRRAAAATANLPDGIQKQVATSNARVLEEPKLLQELLQKGSDKLVALGGEPIDVTGFMTRHGLFNAPEVGNYGILKPHKNSVALLPISDDVLAAQVRESALPLEDGIKAALNRVQQKLREDTSRLEDAVQPYTGYGGRHRSVTGNDNMPIGFSRYTEHTVDLNGQQLNGRHVHELQSDLSRDVRELGPKGGTLEKDQAELATLKSKLAGVDELDPTQQIEKTKLDKRIDALERRISLTAPGKYSLEQPFADFEKNPTVRMQLLIKNAIQSSIRAGQDFVTFPGKESAKPKLYEKLLPNLKQAVKDLGGEKAGFEIKPITLPNPNGDSPTVWGVVWSPETAAKVIDKGVPFNKGGMVERNTDDNRRYL